ncbi:MAG: DUF4864 domain-containing protein [Pyrinomonadaceae bacterium MAG19_C2-C3]|nr:DUF4864 domain-containing protein [Pyrinomonadaceae bacterium MAG19_C2-C3]
MRSPKLTSKLPSQLQPRLLKSHACFAWCLVLSFTFNGCAFDTAHRDPSPVNSSTEATQNQTPKAATKDNPIQSAKGKAEVQPSPDLTPNEVVRLQLQAFKRNDEPTPDSGIEIAFRFASPSNRETTGPLPRFVELVKNPAYRPLLNHRSASQSPIEINDDTARQRVRVVDESGATAIFIFTLSKQTQAPFAGCWMTDGVERAPAGREDNTVIAGGFSTNGYHL